MFLIKGKFKDTESEIIDVADDMESALEMLENYQSTFLPRFNWKLEIAFAL